MANSCVLTPRQYSDEKFDLKNRLMEICMDTYREAGL